MNPTATWAALNGHTLIKHCFPLRGNFGGSARGYGGGYKRRQDDRDREDREERERHAPAQRPGRR